jgi:hypothetical protein
MRTSWGSAAVAAVLFAVAPERARAADCGGARPCACGDRVVEDYRLAQDLGPCRGDGLRLAAKVVFDGGGYAIVGAVPRKTTGLVIPSAGSGSFVQNVTVRGFERGIRLNGAQGVQITNVATHGNGDVKTRVGYGIDVAGGASSNRIERARVYENADEGVHFGTHARGNRLLHSRLWDNGRENVYVLDGVENAIEDCEIRGGGNASAYVKHAKGTVFERNRVFDRPLVIRGAASGTRLIENTFTDAGVVLQTYDDDKLGTTWPTRTLLRGGAIASNQACVRVEGARETTIEGAKLDCSYALEVGEGSAVALLDTPAQRVRCRGPGEVREVRRVEVEFVDGAGAPVPDVEIALAGGGPTIASANARGRFDGELPVSIRTCPGLAERPAGALRVSGGGASRTLPASELRGRVDLDGTSAARED